MASHWDIAIAFIKSPISSRSALTNGMPRFAFSLSGFGSTMSVPVKMCIRDRFYIVVYVDIFMVLVAGGIGGGRINADRLHLHVAGVLQHVDFRLWKDDDLSLIHIYFGKDALSAVTMAAGFIPFGMAVPGATITDQVLISNTNGIINIKIYL